MSTDSYKPDYLTNYELGWKTSWADGTVRWNGAAYWEDWKDFQFSFLGSNSLTVIANAGQARILGIESDVNWLVMDGLTLTAAASYNDAELTSRYCKDPSIVAQLRCAEQARAVCRSLRPSRPTRRRVTCSMCGIWMRMSRVRWSTRTAAGPICAPAIARSWASSKPLPRWISRGGVQRDNWFVDLSLLNAFDEREQLYRYAECTAGTCGAVPYIVTNRPRTIELRFGQKF